MKNASSDDGIQLLFDNVDIPSCFFRCFQLIFNALNAVHDGRMVLPVQEMSDGLKRLGSQLPAEIHNDLSGMRILIIPAFTVNIFCRQLKMLACHFKDHVRCDDFRRMRGNEIGQQHFCGRKIYIFVLKSLFKCF